MTLLTVVLEYKGVKYNTIGYLNILYVGIYMPNMEISVNKKTFVSKKHKLTIILITVVNTTYCVGFKILLNTKNTALEYLFYHAYDMVLN